MIDDDVDEDDGTSSISFCDVDSFGSDALPGPSYMTASGELKMKPLASRR